MDVAYLDFPLEVPDMKVAAVSSDFPMEVASVSQVSSDFPMEVAALSSDCPMKGCWCLCLCCVLVLCFDAPVGSGMYSG